MGPTSGEFSITNSLKFGFSLFCRVLLLAFYFVPVFISCSFVLFRSFKQLFTIEKRWAIFSDRQKKLKRKLNRQNRNKMGEVRQRKLIANHQQFNKWIKQIIGFLTSRFFSHLFLFRVLLFCSFLFNAKIKKTTFEFICHNRAKETSLWALLLFQMSQSSKRSLTLATIW